jgi:hypothetical protein
MEDLIRHKPLTFRKRRDYLPETLEEAEALAASIERAVQEETGHGVRDLHVTVEEDGVVLRGRCESFYCKQLAQHAAMVRAHGEQLINGIEVS